MAIDKLPIKGILFDSTKNAKSLHQSTNNNVKKKGRYFQLSFEIPFEIPKPGLSNFFLSDRHKTIQHVRLMFHVLASRSKT